MIAAAEIGGDEFPEDGSMPASNHGEHHYASVSEPHRHRYSGYCFRFSIALNLALILCSIFMSILFYRIADRNTLSKAPNEATNPFPEINWRPLPGKDQVISRVAFGSCSSQRMPQPYWDTVTMFEPDILVLMGDNVYGDCDPLDFHLNNTAVDPIALKKACAPLEQAYRDMASHPSVQGAASLIPVFATLDDHDYGISDATILNPFKDVARQLFRDFFNINDLPSDGVYRSKSWGPAGRRLQIILLDTRYSRSPFLSTGDPNAPFKPYPDNLRNSSTNIDNSSAESKRMLSEEQWIWFEEQLSQPADLRLVISSVQVLASVSPFECWRHIPSEQGRLIQLIQNKSALVLSGDRHVGGFYWNENGKTIQEVTASSWTHTIPYGAFDTCSSAVECDEIDPRRDGDFVRDNHFGSVEIDWEKRSAVIALRRAQSSYGVPYFHVSDPLHLKKSDAGGVIQDRLITFPF